MKKGDTVYWQELKGEIVNDDCNGDYKFYVVFENLGGFYFTELGQVRENTPPVLSLTPYTFNGFSQERHIEKDTIVYVKDFIERDWYIRYYSHFENGNHYCFSNQLKSTQTVATKIWKYCQVENPLI